eukprot:5538711-Amphidinium_carterae.1
MVRKFEPNLKELDWKLLTHRPLVKGGVCAVSLGFGKFRQNRFIWKHFRKGGTVMITSREFASNIADEGGPKVFGAKTLIKLTMSASSE